MTTEMTVCFPAPRWPGRRVSELDSATVTRWLGPFFPSLVLPDASRPEVEVTYHHDRLFTQWTIYAGERAVRAVHVEIWDADRDQPPESYRSQLPVVIDPLQRLARACGARLLVEGEDMTDATPTQIAERVV